MSDLVGDKETAERCFAQIGRIASEWVHMEDMIGNWILQLAEIRGDRAIGLILVDQLNSHQRINKLVALLHHRRRYAEDRDSKKLQKLVGRFHGALEKRNSIVHGSWTLLPDMPVMRTRYKIQQGRLESDKNWSWSPTKLQIVADEIEALRIELSTFIAEQIRRLGLAR